MENVGLALEILSIYLAYIFEQDKIYKIKEIKDIRKKVYNGDIDALNTVLNNYSELIRKNVNEYKNLKTQKIENEDDYFPQMYNNSEKYLLDSNERNDIPTAIITGGQQGSGKTGIVLKSVQEFNEKKQDVVILDLDAYRGFYRNCFDLIVNYPESYAEITNIFTGKIMEIITEKIIKNKFNFIFEGTLGKSAYTLDLLLKSNIKYNIIVRLLAVCREESLLSNFERYIETYKKIGLGRLTTIKKHDETYNKFTERIKKIEERNVIVEVYCRNTKISNPVMIYRTSKSDNLYCNAYEALIGGRNEEYNNLLDGFKERLDKINDNLWIFQKDNNMLNELKKLNIIFNNKINN